MEKYIISKNLKEFIFEKIYIFVLSMWKLTLGYGMFKMFVLINNELTNQIGVW
jgi:hypothetical protein